MSPCRISGLPTVYDVGDPAERQRLLHEAAGYLWANSRAESHPDRDRQHARNLWTWARDVDLSLAVVLPDLETWRELRGAPEDSDAYDWTGEWTWLDWPNVDKKAGTVRAWCREATEGLQVYSGGDFAGRLHAASALMHLLDHGAGWTIDKGGDE